MPFVRMLVGWRATDQPVRETFTNTLYFNVSALGPDPSPDYQALVNDLWTIYSTKTFTGGRTLDVRAYDMADGEPRPIKARKVAAVGGTFPTGPGQIALALSYFADRNLPRQRGRIFTGPYASPLFAAGTTQRTQLLTLASELLNLGGANVDWSLWSPTNQEHTRISGGWVDDSWDVIRSRKAPATVRQTFSGDG